MYYGIKVYVLKMVPSTVVVESAGLVNNVVDTINVVGVHIGVTVVATVVS